MTGGFSPQEQRIVDVLTAEGHRVERVVATGGIPMPDALVGGVAYEFKSLGWGATNVTVRSAVRHGRRQADHIVLDGRGSGLTRGEAERGLARVLGGRGHRPTSVRILGDDFDLRWPT